MRTTAAIATVSLAAALSACSYAGGAPIACQADSACLEGQACVLSTCVDANDQRLSIVDFEIEPAPGSPLPVQSVRGFDLSPGGRLTVSLKPALRVEGRVRDDQEAAVPGRVVLRPRDFIPGRAIAPSAVTDAAGAFAINAIDGESYAVSVIPDDVGRPPFFDDVGFDATSRFGPVLAVPDIVLPSTRYAITGRVVAGEGVAVLGVQNLEVRALKDARTVSSVGRTDPNGAFSIFVTEQGDDYKLVIGPTPEERSYPTVTLEGVVVADLGEEPNDVGEIALGAVVGPERVFVNVRGVDALPVPFARIFVRGALGNGIFAVSADADGSGNATLDLRHGSYDVIVAGPPSATTGGVLATELVVPTEVDITVLELPQRVSLAGTVIDSFGRPLAGAELTIVRVPGAQDDPALASLAPFFVVSDDDGAYAVAVDPGDYRIGLRAPLGSGAPGFSERVSVGEDGLARDIVLPAPAFVVGTTTFDDGRVVPNAYIRVFSSLVDERGAAILLGEGEAAANGDFEIVVPDIVPDEAR